VVLNLLFGKPAIPDRLTLAACHLALVFLNVWDHDGDRCLEGVATPLVNEVVLGFLGIRKFMAMGLNKVRSVEPTATP
jgi:hypothetical protein